MKVPTLFSLGSLFFVSFSVLMLNNVDPNPRILIFTKTAGYHHACIESGTQDLKLYCQKNGIEVDATSDANDFVKETLENYDAVVFFNTTGDVLNKDQEMAFMKFIQAGKGYVGIHSASDTEYEWDWYGQMVGAYFVSHPKIQEATFIVENKTFSATSFLPAEWVRTDELYNFRFVNEEVNVLISIDENSYEGGANGTHHPMSWYHEYDGGRAFYTAMGHTKESYREELFMQHLLGGIRYCIGGNK